MKIRRPPAPNPTRHFDPATGYTVIDVQETDEGPAPGTALKPLMEQYEGQNFPYRGVETHGVDPIYDVPVPEDQWEGGTIVVNVDEPNDEEEKVLPVRIVTESAREFETWAVAQANVGSNPSVVAGRNLRRTSIKVKNLDALNVIYIAPNLPSCNVYQAYPLDPNETVNLTGSAEIWAFAPVADAYLAILTEYTTG